MEKLKSILETNPRPWLKGKIFGSHSNINPQHTELKLSESSHWLSM